MTSRPPWMPLYVADYLADTGHLGALEHGAYLMLIMHYWRQGSLPADDRSLARVSRTTEQEWLELKPILSSFFDENWRHARIDAELSKAEAKSVARAEAGSRGGLSKASKRVAIATELPKQKPTDALASSSHSESEPSSLRSEGENILSENKPSRKRSKWSYPEDFEKFWDAYPRTPTMSKEKACAAWLRLDGDDRTSATRALPAYRSELKATPWQSACHAVKFLNERRFDGLLEQIHGPHTCPISSKVFVVRGTEQWAAWLKHLGKQSMPAIERNGEYGWNFETEWPPDATIPSNSPLPHPFEAGPSPYTASEREGEGHQATEARFAFAR